jgi:hypothetical protein
LHGILPRSNLLRIVVNAVVDELFLRHSSWRQALQAAAGTCREVLCLVTEKWLASNDCLAEFDASFYMGKSFRSAAANGTLRRS